MKIEYAGLKPIINEHGISFKDGKEDKFMYLTYAIEILNSINHNYEINKKYSHQIEDKITTPNDILKILLKFHPNLEETMNNEINNYKLHLDDEEAQVSNFEHLNDIEKETFIKNLKIMRNYKIQRSKNKIFYMHCIDTIVETIIEHKIKEIDTPFNERFWHILHSIQGHLSNKKVSSTLDITHLNDETKAMLNINIY